MYFRVVQNALFDKFFCHICISNSEGSWSKIRVHKKKYLKTFFNKNAKAALNFLIYKLYLDQDTVSEAIDGRTKIVRQGTVDFLVKFCQPPAICWANFQL